MKGGGKGETPRAGKAWWKHQLFLYLLHPKPKKTWESVVNFPVDESFFFGGEGSFQENPPTKTTVLTG